MSNQIDESSYPDDIVISGISGTFPDSENVEEFKKNLFDGNDMISTVHRWDRPEIFQSIGALKNLDHFDHDFFRMDRQQARIMPNSAKLLLERIFEAVVDAGYNLRQIKGRNIAVVCAQSDSFADEKKIKENYEDTENRVQSEFQLASLISYWFDLNGPSITLDSACSASLYAIDYALKSIQRGECEGALVCAANLCVLPGEHYFKMGVLSRTGLCRPFDADGSGFVRAEAVVAIFLQKRKYARRIYANVIHSKTNCDGFKKEGIAFPSVKQQKDLYEKFFREINVNPTDVSYVETHGTGTKVGDFVEGTSIEDFFCASRTAPLKIGSVKSNMGHAEGAAGLCAMAKMIVSFEEGMIPPTLHFKKPNPQVKGLHNGKLQLVTTTTPIEGQYFAINSFGVGGANGHVLISPHNKIKKSENGSINGSLPRLVTISGRTDEAVNCFLNDLEKNYTDYEYIRLIHEIFSENIDLHYHRGYIILNKNGNHIKSKKTLCNEKRQLWFIFPDGESQWSEMGSYLMKIPIFAESIHKSHEILNSKGVDLLKIITRDDDTQRIKDTLSSYIQTVAIQMAVVDVLKAVGLNPDGMIGHSIGEITCAYADECLTAEQTIQTAYYYGLVTLGAQFIHITAFDVDQEYIAMKTIVPSQIDIISHDDPTYCTISGPTEKMQEFMKQLIEKNISFRGVRTSYTSNDSGSISSAVSNLVLFLKQIIPIPKLRSKKWSCSSASEDQLKYCSVQYFENNFIAPVNFEETFSHIPNNATVVEIGNCEYLKDILKCSEFAFKKSIPLTTRKGESGVEFFLSALGQIYESGHAMKISNLYPAVEFPVSKSTPMISPLIKWKHNEKWQVENLKPEYSLSTVQDIVIDPKSSTYKFITGHVVDQRNLYPGIGYLELVWNVVAKMLQKKADTFSIVFENVRFERATNVPKEGAIKFRITVHLGTNTFEIMEGKALVASGNVRIPKNINREIYDVKSFEDEISNSHILPLNANDLYKELRLKGYHYKGMFKNVVYANAEGTYGRVLWNNNFTTFMDTMAQILLLYADNRQLLVPTYVRKIIIDVDKHFRILETLDKDNPEFPVNCYPNLGLLCSGGVQMIGFGTAEITRRPNTADPVLEMQTFIPYISDEEMDLNLAIRLCLHITIENMCSIKLKTYELLTEECNDETSLISDIIVKTLADLPSIQANVNVLREGELQNVNENESLLGYKISNEDLPEDNSSSIIILSDIRNKTELFEKISKALKENGFIITREPRYQTSSLKDLGFDVCFSRAISSDEEILLLKKIQIKSCRKIIKIKNESYSWISEVKTALENVKPEDNEELIIYSEKEPLSGILGFVNCLRREEKGKTVRCFFITDETAPNFTLDSWIYKSQSDKNLSHNVFKQGKWGSYRHLPYKPVEEIDVTQAYCALEKRGDLSSFKWFEHSLDPTTYKDSNTKFLVQVYFSSINFRDVMLSAGKISISNQHIFYSRLQENFLGSEFSGRDVNGRRLMGVVCYNGLATMVEASSHFTWLVPDHISLEEAASIPVVYTTVVWALFFRIQLKKKTSILIHAGSGGIGQAAINICLHYGCNIFTTVGTPEKIEFIKKNYPQIPENQICNSRDTSFEKIIMKQTNGKGVDIVLNSLSEEKLNASLRCVANGGHFLEIGKFDMAKNNCIDTSHFLRNITFHSIQLDSHMVHPTKMSKALQTKIQEMIDQGIIKPINRTIFHINEVESAIRYMAAGKHIGKVLIKIREEEKDRLAKPSNLHIKAKPRVICNGKKSYIIIGGLGGFGLELADWLIIRGARNIVLSSRNGVKNGYQSYRIKLWRSYGVNVIICTEDVTQETGVKQLLLVSNSLGPVAGIFNSALVLKDDPFLKQNEETFSAVIAPKAIATAHLDKLSREMCPYLEHFVVFSSLVCGRGNLDQTNYGIANSIMERICESRRAENLPALAIQWGSIGEVGAVAEFLKDNSTIGGTLQQNIRSCLETLNLFMKQSNPIVASMIVAEKHRVDADIIQTMANILGIKDLKTISMAWTLPEFGMDSILAAETKQILESEFNMFFTPEDLRNMTFAKLYKLKEEKKNGLKSEEKSKTQYQQVLMDVKTVKEPFIRFHLDNGGSNKKHPVRKNAILFVLPGTEGLASFMEPLMKNLQIQAICFQYYQDNLPTNSLSQMGEYFVELILQILGPEQEFYIVGYSLGGLFALEVAHILEGKGRKGYLWLIDSSPSFCTEMISNFLNKNEFSDDEGLQSYICIQLLKFISPEMSKEMFFSNVKKANSWESKKKVICSAISQTHIDENIMNKILDKSYSLTKLIPSYELNHKISDTICTLIRTTDSQHDLGVSYDLDKYFKNPVQVHQIEGSHYTILGKPKTAEIIMNCPVWMENTFN